MLHSGIIGGGAIRYTLGIWRSSSRFVSLSSSCSRSFGSILHGRLKVDLVQYLTAWRNFPRFSKLVALKSVGKSSGLKSCLDPGLRVVRNRSRSFWILGQWKIWCSTTLVHAVEQRGQNLWKDLEWNMDLINALRDEGFRHFEARKSGLDMWYFLDANATSK